MSGVELREVRNPRFEEALRRIKNIHDLKNKDYSAGGPYDNFEIVAKATGLGVQYVFLVQIANKVARLNSLYAQEGTANFETTDDTWLDLATYSTMGFSYFMEDPKAKK